MSNKYICNDSIQNIYKRNDLIYNKKKLEKNLSNTSNKINSNLYNNISSHCFAKTTKNSPRFMNSSKSNFLRNKSFNLQHYSKQISKSNLGIENSLDSSYGMKKLKFRTKNINLNIKTINMNLEIKKFPNETNSDSLNHNNSSLIKNKNRKLNYKIKFHHKLKNQIYDINNNIYSIYNNKKENITNTLNDNYSNSTEKNKNNNRILNISKHRTNTAIYRFNKSKEQTNKDKFSSIKKKTKYLSIKKKMDGNNYENKKNDRLFNSLKKNFVNKNSYKKRYNDNTYNEKIKLRKIVKDNSKNTTPKNAHEKLKINNKTKFNEISFNNIPKIFQFNNNNNKKQTRNVNYHKKQPSLSLTKTSNISQCNFAESISLDNMFNQVTINKTQNNTSNYNNSTTISNDKSIQYTNAISMYNKLIKENGQLQKENNELKQNSQILFKHIKQLNSIINILKNIMSNIISIYKSNFNNIINEFHKKEDEMNSKIKKYNEYLKKIIFSSKYYCASELNKEKKISEIMHQTLTENKILRNLYNNLLLFDINNSRMYSNQSDNICEENEEQDKISHSNIISERNISHRSNKFFEEENEEKNSLSKRCTTVIKGGRNVIDILGSNKHSQSRNYNNKNELNTDAINGNKHLQKFFIRKLNYKIKK